MLKRSRAAWWLLPLDQGGSIQADRLEPDQELVVAAGRLHNRVQPERPAVAEPGPGLLQCGAGLGEGRLLLQPVRLPQVRLHRPRGANLPTDQRAPGAKQRWSPPTT